MTERAAKYKALEAELKALMDRDDAIRDEMDVLWAAMTLDELDEVDPLRDGTRRRDSW